MRTACHIHQQLQFVVLIYKKEERVQGAPCLQKARTWGSHRQWWDSHRCERALYQATWSHSGNPSVCVYAHMCLADATSVLLSTTSLLLFHGHLQFWLISCKTALLAMPSCLKLKILADLSYLFLSLLLNLTVDSLILPSLLLLWLQEAQIGVLKQGRRAQNEEYSGIFM